MTKEEAYQAFLSALEVGGFTTVTGPGGIIKIVALKDAISSPIPIYVDSTPGDRQLCDEAYLAAEYQRPRYVERDQGFDFGKMETCLPTLQPTHW